MVLRRLFDLLLLFITLTWRISISHSLQDNNVDIGFEGVSIEKMHWPQVCSETTTQIKFQGRKIMNNIVMKDGDASAKYGSLGVSKISNAASWERAETGFQYVEKRKNGRKIISQDDDGSSFVAFDADYPGPRYHPPKNN